MNTKAKTKQISEDVNTTMRLQKQNTLSYYNLTNISIEYLFCHCYFLIMPKACCSSYTMAFKIKVIAEAVEKSSEIALDYGLSESMMQHGRRDQATILQTLSYKWNPVSCEKNMPHFCVKY